MRSIRYLSILLLAMLLGVEVAAQDDFNPVSPGDPGVPPQKLTLVASPADGGTVSGGGRYVPETRVTVTASAKTNWQFVSWTDEQGNVLSTDRTYRHTKSDRSETLTAYFVYNPGSPADPVPGTQQVYYHLTVLADEGGTVSGGGRYRAGTRVNLSASCKTNFDFVAWVNEEGEIVSTDRYFNYTTKEYSETLTATFLFNPNSPADPNDPILRKKVTVIVVDDGGTASGATTALGGTTITLSAYPNPGYKFLGWYLCDEFYTSLRTFNYTVNNDGCNSFEARFEFDPDSPGDPNTPMDKQFSIYLMSPITYPGKDVDCVVYLSNPYSPLKDMHFNLTFPDGLTPDVQNIALCEGMDDYSVSAVATGEPNVYTITLLGGTVAPGNKEIFRIRVAVPETTPLGINYQLKINQVSVTQEDNTTCTTGTRNGRISIYKLGDSNGDGIVNILDRINLVGYVGTESADEDSFIKEVSDINDDGIFSILDVIGVSDIIANE